MHRPTSATGLGQRDKGTKTAMAFGEMVHFRPGALAFFVILVRRDIDKLYNVSSLGMYTEYREARSMRIENATQTNTRQRFPV